MIGHISCPPSTILLSAASTPHEIWIKRQHTICCIKSVSVSGSTTYTAESCLNLRQSQSVIKRHSLRLCQSRWMYGAFSILQSYRAWLSVSLRDMCEWIYVASSAYSDVYLGACCNIIYVWVKLYLRDTYKIHIPYHGHKHTNLYR